MERVKTKFSLKQFQIFDLVVLKQWPVATVAQSLGVSLVNVYVIRHRISSAIKKETRHLKSQLEKEALVKASLEQIVRRKIPPGIFIVAAHGV